jgi:acyl-coenzyme A thioesterase PaaI-like protein
MPLAPRTLLRLVSLRIPVLFFLGPRVVRLDEEVCEVRIPLGWRSRNHVGTMYLGALCAGADLAAGLPAAHLVFSSHRDVVLLFAGMRAEFLKRADGDVLFRSGQGRAIAAAVRRAAETGERQTLPVEVIATCPGKHGQEPVARFTMDLTLKRRGEPGPGSGASADAPARRATGPR